MWDSLPLGTTFIASDLLLLTEVLLVEVLTIAAEDEDSIIEEELAPGAACFAPEAGDFDFDGGEEVD